MASLVLGAGIPALFALGVRLTATGAGGRRDDEGTGSRGRDRRPGDLFLVAGLAVALGMP